MTRVSTEAVQRLDTSERSDVYLLPVRGGAYLRLSAAALRLLRAVEAGTTFEELAVMARGGDGRRVTPADVKAAYGVILARIAQTEKETQKLAGGFWLRVRLIPAAVVERIAAVCAVAYHPVVAVLLVSLIGIGVGLALMGRAHHVPPHSGDFWPGYLLFLGSLLAHEIGHASACARYRARPSEIGLLFYLVYPAFYSNVSAAWALRRWQRVIVDLGGIYFELVFGAVCAFAYVIGHWEPLRVTLTLIAASCFVSLNPVLKFDGYWVVADALGVTNLSRQPALLVGRLVRRLRGHIVEPLPWTAPVVWTLAAYAVVSFAFLVGFMGALAPRIANIACHYPTLFGEVGRSLGHRSWPPKLAEFATATYILLFAGLITLRITRSLVRYAVRGGSRASARCPIPQDQSWG